MLVDLDHICVRSNRFHLEIISHTAGDPPAAKHWMKTDDEYSTARNPIDFAPSAPPFGGRGNGIEDFGYRQELKRTLKFSDLLVYGLIFMVPIAPFAIFGVFQASGGMVAMAYIVGMLAMMCTANSYAQMVQAFPMSGSVYTYVGRGITRVLGFAGGMDDSSNYVLIPAHPLLGPASIAMNGMIPSVPLWVWLISPRSWSSTP